MNKEDLKIRLLENLSKSRSNDPHSDIGFYIHQTRSLLFAYTILGEDDIRNGKKLIEPAFTHNAIPAKLSDIEEIYYHILNKYEYANETLYSLKTNILDLQYHTLYLAYVKNKYDRKVSKISSIFYDLSQVGRLIWNTAKLFVINTSSRFYFSYYYEKEREVMKELFPIKTKYELDNDDYMEDNEEEENKDNIISDELTKNNKISLENITIKLNYMILNKLEKNISSIFHKIDEKIDEYNMKINYSEKYQEIENITNNSNISKYILSKEINDLKNLYQWQNKIISYGLICFCISLLFLLKKIYHFSKYKKVIKIYYKKI